ncbi:nitrite reductase [Gloeomargarita lithophora Alchichica-D10]|uniref:Nitrite reductase n=1 Tax=Gloeomargarita lithophora Alchichica-D10 TaxID=1188229 RepID=A0A1J0ADR3_9CYAN|nr:nitrite reductase [Gloeomargarita lithophora Alchichica-D10]
MANKIEMIKTAKDGLAVREELEEFVRRGWEHIDREDLEHRLKWVGIFFRKSTPGKFMLRLRVPQGILTAAQMQVLAQILADCEADGVGDITTRQNIQLRGIDFANIPHIFQALEQVGLTSVQSGMDNVRNITSSPLAGLDPDELYDTRSLVQEVQDMITNGGKGNPEFTNLPRKFNIAINGCRDNSTHAEINDLAFIPAYEQSNPNLTFGFNILVGGFFSSKRVATAIPLDAWVTPAQVVEVCRAILRVFRDHGLRENRQQSRLMWLIDAWGMAKFRAEVMAQLGYDLPPAAPQDEMRWPKQDHLGLHPQKQSGLYYAGLHIPVGRISAEDMFEFARLANQYGQGELRLTVEQNLIIPHITDAKIPSFLQESILQKFPLQPTLLMRGLVSCTGNQFCNLAIIETKNRAVDLVSELETLLQLKQPIRIHWSGCPNSCGQPQVGDIGFIGCKAKKNGKPVDGVDIYLGGKVGHEATLGNCVRKGVPCEDLKWTLVDLMIRHFEAIPRPGVIFESAGTNGEKYPLSSPTSVV